MIEILIFEYLKERLSVPAFLEIETDMPDSYVVFEKTSGAKSNHILSSTFAFQSYGSSMYEAAKLNEEVMTLIEDMIILDEIAKVSLNSNYNFTDTETKKYRYQAVFDITHY
ncbi:MAG TPA: hypothetical protein DCZ00_02280 [Lactococcus sp.]|uniref:hypothetical protein n=1 Tax=Lactococcus TaxID=1357 RepID=UPI000E95CE3D|nr:MULTISPECIES: hypothetical protein [Lactococcus]HBC90254.1 hypothetical protein [Lactococcus sp.]